MSNPAFRLTILSAALLAASHPAWATNGDQRVGINATQAGMGGAVVAMPEDSGTLFTNPAGLASLGMDKLRLDMGFSLLNPPRAINGVESDSNYYFMPTGAVSFRLSPKLYLGVGMAGVGGFGVDVPDAFPPAPGNQAIATQREVLQFAPGMAYQVNDQLAVGGSLNIYNQSMAISNPQFSLPQNRQFGFGASLGATYQATPALRLGLSYSTKSNASAHQFNTSLGTVELDMDGPATLALGVAFTGVPGLVAEFDVKQIFFADVRDQVAVERPVGYTGPVPPVMGFGWEDQTVYALGVRKQLGKDMTVRVGFNYGASPIEVDDVNNNLGSVAIVEKQLTLGLTRRLTENLSGNFAYGHAFHNELVSPTGTRIELEQNWLHFQLSYSH